MKKSWFSNLSLTQSYRLRYNINGFAWLVYAICGLFDNTVCKVIRVIAMAIAVLCLVSFFRKGEEEDEMALNHIYRAKAYTFDLLYAVMLISGIISGCGANFNINLNKVFGFIVAAVNIGIGFIFSHLEKVGD